MACRSPSVVHLVCSPSATPVKAYDAPEACVRLGIPSKAEDNDSQEAFSSKRLYVVRRLKGRERAALLDLAGRVLREHQAPDLRDLVSELTVQGERRVSPLVPCEIFGASVVSDDPGGHFGATSLQAQFDRLNLRNGDW